MLSSYFREDEADPPIIIPPNLESVSGEDLQYVVQELLKRIDHKAQATFQKSKIEIEKSKEVTAQSVKDQAQHIDDVEKELASHRGELALVPAEVKASLIIQEAASKERKEQLNALAAMHADLEALRDELAKLKSSLTNHTNKATTRVLALETQVQGLDAQVKNGDDLHTSHKKEVHLQLQELTSQKSDYDKAVEQSGAARQQVKNLEAELAKLREDFQKKTEESKTLSGNMDALVSSVKDLSQKQSENLKHLQELKTEMSTQGDKLSKATDKKTNVEEVGKAVENALRTEINDIKEQCKSSLAAETSTMKKEIEELKHSAADTASEKKKGQEAIDKICLSLEKIEEYKHQVHTQAANDRLASSQENAKLAENIENLTERIMSDIQQAVNVESEHRGKVHAAEKAAREKDVAVLQAALKDVTDKFKIMEDKVTKQTAVDILRQALTPELQRLNSKTTEIDANLSKFGKQLSESKKQQETVDGAIDKRLASLENSHTQHRELTLQSFKDMQDNHDASKKSAGETDRGVADIKAQLEDTKVSMDSLKKQMNEVVNTVQNVSTQSNNAIRDNENRAKDQDNKIDKMSIEVENSRQAILVKIGKNTERIDLLKANIDDEVAARCVRDAELQAKLSTECSALRLLIDSKEKRPVSRDISLDAPPTKDDEATVNKEKDEVQQQLQSVREKMDKLNNSRDDALNQLRLHKDDVNKRFVEVHQKQTDLRRKISEGAVKTESILQELHHEIDTRIEKENELSTHFTKGIDEERSYRTREVQQTRYDVIAAVEREREERVKENTEQRTTMAKALRQMKITLDDDDDRSWFRWGSKATAKTDEKPTQTDEVGPAGKDDDKDDLE